jgi:hypothetical protein
MLQVVAIKCIAIYVFDGILVRICAMFAFALPVHWHISVVLCFSAWVLFSGNL